MSIRTMTVGAAAAAPTSPRGETYVSATIAGTMTETQAQFEDFYATTAPGVRRQLLGLTRDLPEAQDCVQEAFARAWQSWGRVSQHPDPEAWVRTVAYRCAVSRFRRTRNRLLAHARDSRPQVAEMSSDHVVLVAARDSFLGCSAKSLPFTTSPICPSRTWRRPWVAPPGR